MACGPLMRRSRFAGRILGVAFVGLGLHATQASAVPSFSRQTGMACAACHTVFPELTPFGRQFKLRGYTLGAQLAGKPFPYNLPLAIGLQAGHTSIKDPNKGANAGQDFPRADKTILQQAAFYYGGKIAGKLGALVQYNWDGLEQKWGAEMADIRYADSITTENNELLYGISVANSPTVQDIWATSPMWSFPHLSDAGIRPMNTSLFDMTLDNQIGAVSFYADYDGQFYGEAGFFHNGKSGIFRPLNWGDELTTAIAGNAPHLRLAWEKNTGPHSFEIGVHALWADIYPDPQDPHGPTDRYTDFAFDSQYQYNGSVHLVSLHAFLDHEQRRWNASFPAGMASNPSDGLNTLRVDAHYWYRREIGGGIGFFNYWGDSDMLKYGMGGTPSAAGNATGSPDTRGWIIEADYLPLKDTQNLKLGLRYTAYTKFNGARNNYNGFGRNASDNNALFAYLWFLY